MEYGSLPDGTQVRRWRPVTPLDQRWRAAMTPKATELRDLWLRRRAELCAAGKLDGAVATLVKSWEARGYLPRPVPTGGRPAQSVLLELGFDACVAASLDPEDPDASEFPTPSARSQAADGLLKVIKEDRDLTPADVAKLHGLTCPTLKPKAYPGIGDPSRLSRFQARGRFRSHPAIVLGSDRVFKEGCPPERVSQEVLAMAKATGDARRAGILGPARAAWTLYALSVVHPFYDGNGRVARMLGSFVLVRDGGFPLLIPPALHKIYLDAFARARLGQPQMLVRLVADCQSAILSEALAVL
jgi:Fic/DOC family